MRAHTPAEVEAMFHAGQDAYFRLVPGGFWDGKNEQDLVKGCRVLWKGGAKGMAGEESTKVEFFSGTVHAWEDYDFVILSFEATPTHAELSAVFQWRTIV